MPWKEIQPMTERIRFIADYLTPWYCVAQVNAAIRRLKTGPMSKHLASNDGDWRLVYQLTRRPARKKPSESEAEQQRFAFEQAA